MDLGTIVAQLFSPAVATGVAAGALLLLAAAHSALGEKEILQPLFNDGRWDIGLPRGPLQVLLRGAWHMTSVAWIALAAVLLGLSVPLAIAAVGLLSGLPLVIGIRGHLAWPVFFGGALAALDLAGRLPEALLMALVGAAAVVASGASAVHVYWAAGGTKGMASAVPTHDDGRPVFSPGPIACAAVAVALGVFVALVLLVAAGVGGGWPTGLLLCAVGLLALRALGDGRRVGFSKQEHISPFARHDDALYTPLVVVMLFGALAALRLAAAGLG